MKGKISIKNTPFVTSVVLALVIIASALSWSFFVKTRPTGQPNLPVTPTPSTGNPIVRENAFGGTNGWRILQGEGASIEIQAYANATSVQPGENLTFYVSTSKEGMLYSIGIYRLGWYKGTGGRLMYSRTGLQGHMQGYYNPANDLLTNCKSCYVDKATGLIEANWQPSFTFTIPSDWTTGVYLAKFADNSGWQTYVPFDVRGNAHSRYVVVTPDTTCAAYNIWGGYSLYEVGKSTRDENTSQRKGVKVSFDRPYADAYGSCQVLSLEANAIRWLESQGYDVSYISSVDLHEHPEQLLQHRAYISIGHDEYWTKEMRDGVQHARDAGVGLAFLGANASYWQMRFGPDTAKQPDRTIVCYKVNTDLNNLNQDPLYGQDNTRVTALWRDDVLKRPENALIGIMYSSLNSAQAFPWQVNAPVQSPFLNGTGLQAGHQYGCDLIGYEWDRVFNNGATPPGLQVLSTSRTMDLDNLSDTSNTTYYVANSGALVFATGSLSWTAGLDTYRFDTNTKCTIQDRVVPGMQILMSHVMDALVGQH